MIDIIKHPGSPDAIYGENSIRALNIDKAWYWYEIRGYEGHGTILMKKGNLWCIDDLGHGSCFGPTDHITFDGVLLDKLKEKHSEILCEDAIKLLKLARVYSKVT